MKGKFSIDLPGFGVLTAHPEHTDCPICSAVRFWEKWVEYLNHIDPCQWADGRLGRAVQQTVNLERE